MIEQIFEDKQQKVIKLSQQQQKQIQGILKQIKIEHSKYTDNQIDYLINPQSYNNNSQKPSIKHSIQSQLSAYSQNDQYLLSRQNSLHSNQYHKYFNQQQSSNNQDSNSQPTSYQSDDQFNYQLTKQEMNINQLFLFNYQKNQQQLQTPIISSKQRFQKQLSSQNFPYTHIYKQIQQLQIPYTLQQVQKQYPSFLISKPTYQIQSTIKQKKSALSTSLIKQHITKIDIACLQSNKYFMAIGTHSHNIIIHQLYSNKPYQVIQVFKPGSSILSVKWSPSLQYLLVSNTNEQIKMYQLRQYTQSGSQQQMKWLKTPYQIFYLQYPKLKCSIINCYFIQENPLKVLLVDQQYEIYIVEMKKQFMSLKPSINKLPIKFNTFFQLKLIKLYDSNNNYGTLMVVGGEEYVTIAKIQPKFEIILVYDKQKHFPNAKRGGYPNIIINEDNKLQPQIIIVWDKYMQIIRLRVQQLDPFTYKIQTLVKYTFPDSSLLLGKLSDTLIYQLTRLQLKIYSLNQIYKFNYNNTNSNYAMAANPNNNSQINIQNVVQRQQTENKKVNIQQRRFAQAIYSKKIDYEQFIQGDKLQQMISNNVIQLPALRFINKFISVSLNNPLAKSNSSYSNNTLFICFKQYIYSVSIQPFSNYIQKTIQQINDWKVGLQLINDAISKQITIFDNMKPKLLIKQLKQYSIRYIQFLKSVIPDIQSNIEIWKQQICYLFNILINSKLYKYLLKQILIKLYRISPQLIKTFQPFILMNKINYIQVETLDLLLSVVDRQIGRRLIYSIKNNNLQITNTNNSNSESNNNRQSDNNQLAHLINPILIRYEFYLQLIWINQFFGDYYTPFVILISKYQQKYSIKSNQFINQFQNQYQSKYQQKPSNQIIDLQLYNFKLSKSQLVKLLSFLSFDNFRLINLSQYNKFFAHQQLFHVSKIKVKYLIQTLIPIFHIKLNNILLHNCPQQFFQYILQQIFYGNTLYTINQLNTIDSNNRKDLKIQIIQNIQFRQVVQVQQQARYWLLIIRLMIRKVITKKVIPGLYYLTLQFQNQSNTLYSLIDIFARQCSKFIDQQLYSIDNEKKTQLFQKLIHSQYIQFLKLLGAQLNRQIQVLQAIINCKRLHNVQLIQYMTHILNKSLYVSKQNQIKTLSKIKNILKQNIKLFTSIDPQKTSQFIITNFKQQLKQFISYLQQTPKQQLNLLKQVLTHYNYGQFLNKQKCKYLQLLAITGQKSLILQQIKSHMFPLDQSIDICKKYQILDALAFLLVKSGGTGNSTLAIQIYFKIIKQHIQNYKYNRKTQERWLQLKSNMLNQLHKSIQVCIELDIKGTHNQQTQWFLIIQQLEALKKFVYKTCSPDVQSSVKLIILQTLYPELIMKLLDQVPNAILLNFLQKSLTHLQPQASQLFIQQMVKALISQKQILKNAQHQISQCQIHQRKIMFIQCLKGFKTLNRCWQCMKKDIQTKIHYTCGHDIHPACNQDVKQCISCKNNEQSLIWRQVNQKDKVQKVIYYNPPDPNAQKTQSEIIRLSRQQKLRKFDQFINQKSVTNILL